jgi:MFS family permease
VSSGGEAPEANESGSDPSRSAHTLATLIPLGIANHAVLAGSRVTASLDALGRGASAFTVGVMMALYALLPMVLAVAAGRLSDRAGVRKPMVVGTAGVAVGAALPVLFPGMPALFASAAIVGAGFMVFQVAAQNATGELGGPLVRARNFSLLALGYSISGFIGPLAAGFAIDHAGFPATFALLAVVPLAPLLILASGRPALPRLRPPDASAHRGGVRALMRHRLLRRALAINALFAVGWDLHTVFVPIYGEKLGLSASEIGLVLASFAAATFTVRLAMPLIVRHIGAGPRRRALASPARAAASDARGEHESEQRVLIAALFVAGAVYLAYPFAHAIAALLVLSFSLGLALGTGQPMVMALLHTHAPPGRLGEAAGVRMSLVNSMAVAVPLVFGAFGAAVGIAPVFWSVGACLAAGGFIARHAARTA